MTDHEIEQLSVAIAKALQAARSVSDSEHYDHHIWISGKITRDKESREFWHKMTEHATKWGMISLLSFGFYALWLGLKAIVKAAT